MIGNAVITLVIALVAVTVGMILMIAKLFRKVEQGKALVVSTMRSVDVTFTGRVVFPVIHKAEIMDISVKTIEIDRRGHEGLICQDNIRADIKVTFFVRVNKTKEDVTKVAQAIGCARGSNQATLEELFSAKFSEALKTVGKQLDFTDLYTKRDDFRDRIIEVIGTNLNGYVLEDAAIDFLEQTPVAKLDEHNILDAQGIRKITELTTLEHIRTNEYLNNEKKLITKQDVEAAEAIFELERQKADAQAKQTREIETMKAREQAETLKVQAEERLKHEAARIKTDEEVAVQEENRQRQVEVAKKNRERVVAVEGERVEKDRMLEVVAREREVELQRIDKDMALEREKREIANVIRERIAVERTVAEEEENIKTLRHVEDARRKREADVIAAEGKAQEALVRDIKAAEAAAEAAIHKAQEQVRAAEAEAQEKLVKEVKAGEAAEKAATHHAREQVTMAQAELETTERRAQARVRMADAELEATQKQAQGQTHLADALRAEKAAPGLAEVQVKEQDAAAIEKVGLAEVRVRQAEADAIEKVGFTEAKVLREKAAAEAAGLLERYQAESQGLREKSDALRTFDDPSRAHEEFRLGLELRRDVDLASIQAQREIAEDQARLIAEGLKEADIDIVGGESVFFDRLVGAIGLGKSVDEFVGRSSFVRGLVGESGNGAASRLADVKTLLQKLVSDSTGVSREKLAQVLEAAGESGSEKKPPEPKHS